MNRSIFLFTVLFFSLPQFCFSMDHSAFEFEEFDCGSKTSYSNVLSARARVGDDTVVVRSSRKGDRLQYLLSCSDRRCPEVPFFIAKRFFNHCLARSEPGIIAHLLHFTVNDIPCGFVHFGRMKTFGVQTDFDKWSEYSPKIEPSMMRLWDSLGIIQQVEIGDDFRQKNLTRVGKRGIAQLLPIFSLKSKPRQQKAMIETSVQIVQRLKEDGDVLLPEKMGRGEAELENASPHKVIIELSDTTTQGPLLRETQFNEIGGYPKKDQRAFWRGL